MSIFIIKEGKLKHHQDDRVYYKAECEKCGAIYAFDESDVIDDTRTVLSPYAVNGGVMEVKKYIICPCCNRIKYHKDFTHITRDEFEKYKEKYDE